MSDYLVLAYYHFNPIAHPAEEVLLHKEFFKERDISSRIYISEAGINGQMSGKKEDAEAYMNWMHSHSPFEDVRFKIHTHHENVFPRKTVKYRKQLVALDEEVDLSQTGEHLSPKQWKEKLNEQSKPILLDVRNEYEWKVGRFEGAECPPCDNFREFKQYADKLKERVDPKTTPVMMYCTGGIRCELYSSLLKKGGFEEVYQLDGGVIDYGLKEGSTHWLGKLFVFDDRLTVPISSEETPVIGECHRCRVPIDTYYNCASADCNKLFICCPSCLKEFNGCCCEICQNGPRVRPYHHQDPHKPFRRLHNYINEERPSEA